MNNLPVRSMVTYGAQDTGLILKTDISGYPEFGFFLHGMDICGHLPIGDLSQEFMVFTPDIGVLMSDFMVV